MNAPGFLINLFISQGKRILERNIVPKIVHKTILVKITARANPLMNDGARSQRKFTNHLPWHSRTFLHVRVHCIFWCGFLAKYVSSGLTHSEAMASSST